MNWDAVVKTRQRPWLPNPEASNLKVKHVVDVPLVGTFELDLKAWVFLPLADSDDAAIWAYLPLDTEQLEQIDGQKFASADELIMTIAAWARPGTRVIFAFAVDNMIVQYHDATITRNLFGSGQEALSWFCAAIPPRLSVHEGATEDALQAERLGAVQEAMRELVAG